MVAWRYEISLLVSTREEKFHISKQPCNILFIIIINTNEILKAHLVFHWCLHNKFYFDTSILFSCMDSECHQQQRL